MQCAKFHAVPSFNDGGVFWRWVINLLSFVNCAGER